MLLIEMEFLGDNFRFPVRNAVERDRMSAIDPDSLE